jgi:hypothetical protein
MGNFVRVLAGIPTGGVLASQVDGSYPLVVAKPEIDNNFQTLLLSAEVYVDNVVTRTYTAQWRPIGEVKAFVLERLQKVRQSTLDKFQKRSVGLSRVYAENVKAAELHLAGSTAVMASGTTPSEYLRVMGAQIGLSPEAFAGYIMAENQRLGPAALTIEERYLAVKVALAGNSAANIYAKWVSFKGFCDSVVTE